MNWQVMWCRLESNAIQRWTGENRLVCYGTCLRLPGWEKARLMLLLTPVLPAVSCLPLLISVGLSTVCSAGRHIDQTAKQLDSGSAGK